MIATVRGIVAAAGLSDVVVETNDIGLHISVPRGLALSLRVGEPIFLHTVLIPREDEWLLFGFATPEDKAIFTLLRGVTGVGPRTALAILSELSAAEISDAVDSGDDAPFKAVSGIGQKTASLIIVSLSGKMPRTGGSDVTGLTDALVGLGWAAARAREVARETIANSPDSTMAERLRIALASIGGSA